MACQLLSMQASLFAYCREFPHDLAVKQCWNVLSFVLCIQIELSTSFDGIGSYLEDTSEITHKIRIFHSGSPATKVLLKSPATLQNFLFLKSMQLPEYSSNSHPMGLFRTFLRVFNMKDVKLIGLTYFGSTVSFCCFSSFSPSDHLSYT